MKVLVVDDIDANRKLLRLNLESHGIETMEASDGVEALALMEDQMPDAIISDILMPNMDGYRLCRTVRGSERLRCLPFIFYTSTYTSPADEKFAMDCGANLYLRKPAPSHVVLQSLRDLAAIPPDALLRHSTSADETLVMKEYSQVLIGKLEDKNEDLRIARDELARANEDLERRVQERTAELVAANQELEAFSHSIAHDLRSPIMVIGSFCEIIIGECLGKVNEPTLKHLNYINEAARRMTELTQDLLYLARASRTEISREWVDLSALALAIFDDLKVLHPERHIRLSVLHGLVANGDRALLRIALENLIGNAWKFSGKVDRAEIEFGVRDEGGERAYFIRDNGAGFDMAKAEKLFSSFERLHSADEFPGTGIGLTTVRRVITRHGGRIWAQAAPGQGAAFFFTLGSEDRQE